MLSTIIIEELKAERERQGLSLEEVANKIGVSNSAVWNWEHHKKIPSLFNAVHWAIALNMAIELVDEPTKVDIGHKKGYW